MSDWEVERVTGKCAATGRAFEEGEAYFAALFEGPEGLQRRDYSLQAWSGPPEGCFCYWRGRVPVKEKKPVTIAVDNALLVHLFQRLEEEDSEFKQQLRFVLALLLMRRRLLRFERTVRDADREQWQVRLVQDQTVHQVVNPQLTEAQIERLSAQLSAILSGDAQAVEALERPEDAAAAPAPEARSAGEAPAQDSEGPGNAGDGNAACEPTGEPQG